MQIGEILTSEVLGYSQASGNSKLQANVFLKNIFPLLYCIGGYANNII